MKGKKKKGPLRGTIEARLQQAAKRRSIAAMRAVDAWHAACLTAIERGTASREHLTDVVVLSQTAKSYEGTYAAFQIEFREAAKALKRRLSESLPDLTLFYFFRETTGAEAYELVIRVRR